MEEFDNHSLARLEAYFIAAVRTEVLHLNDTSLFGSLGGNRVASVLGTMPKVNAIATSGLYGAHITFSASITAHHYAEMLSPVLARRHATAPLAINFLNGSLDVQRVVEPGVSHVMDIGCVQRPALPSCDQAQSPEVPSTEEPESGGQRGQQSGDGLDTVLIVCFSCGVMCSVIFLPAAELLPSGRLLWVLTILFAFGIAGGLSAVIASGVGVVREDSAYGRWYDETCAQPKRWRFAAINLGIALASIVAVTVRRVLRRTSICGMSRTRVAQAPPFKIAGEPACSTVSYS